ncbi:MAG: ATP-dependent zinc metalloprotease FtsH, partial [Oscillospiraceae bacterium]|nr:ATP-dependent zinc metalloprotease FtsH [Oscillospiraceae bacterium]
YIPPAEQPWWLTYLPSLLLLVVMVVFWVIMMRQTRGGGGMMNFSKAKARGPEQGVKVTFADVAGADEEKEELVEVVEFLRNPNQFNALGARIPKGVLLMGPPGTGKTLLAKAVAGEAGVPFFSISGSDFVEMFVGVGASRVRDLFEQAKKSAPSIIFIDEIDAVGRHRGAGLGGGHDEREQTLNQLLVEMDGFAANVGVIVMAATNRKDILDPALLRPGRFDRQIVVNYPDIKGREEILKVHARNKPIGPDVDLAVVARSTGGFTGADLENLLNEAALLAGRKGYKAITMAEIEEATIKVMVGPEKKSHVVTENARKLTAYHEAGHAVATYYCPTQDKVHQISIIPRGWAGGYTLSLPEGERTYRTKGEMQEDIVVLLGGRVAEQLTLDDISTGASNDIQRASETARKMVTRFGFSEKLGPIVYGSDQEEVFLGMEMGHSRNYSEDVASQIDQEVRGIIEAGYSKCTAILEEHMDQLKMIAEYLLEHEKMDGETFEKMMKGEEVEPPKPVEPLAAPAAEQPAAEAPSTEEAPAQDAVPEEPQP